MGGRYTLLCMSGNKCGPKERLAETTEAIGTEEEEEEEEEEDGTGGGTGAGGGAESAKSGTTPSTRIACRASSIHWYSRLSDESASVPSRSATKAGGGHREEMEARQAMKAGEERSRAFFRPKPPRARGCERREVAMWGGDVRESDDSSSCAMSSLASAVLSTSKSNASTSHSRHVGAILRSRWLSLGTPHLRSSIME